MIGGVSMMDVVRIFCIFSFLSLLVTLFLYIDHLVIANLVLLLIYIYIYILRLLLLSFTYLYMYCFFSLFMHMILIYYMQSIIFVSH